MADSAECWLNTISKASLYHQGKSTAMFHLSRMLSDYEHQVYTASIVNVAQFILDKAIDLYKLE